MAEYICSICGKPFRSYNPHPQYCSIRCKGEAQIASLDPSEIRRLYWTERASQHEVANALGTSQKAVFAAMRRHGIPTRKAATRDQWGENNPNWKGEMAGYQAKHLRIQKLLGTPVRCDACSTNDPSLTYDWANVNGDYDDPADFIRLCRSCHHRFDARSANFAGGRQ